MIKIIFLFILLFGFFACSGPTPDVRGIPSEILIEEEARLAAQEFCECAQDAGFDPSQMVADMDFDYSGFGRDFKHCFQSLREEYILPKNGNREEQRKFIKSLIHALLESKCMNQLLEAIPPMTFDFLLNYPTLSY